MRSEGLFSRYRLELVVVGLAIVVLIAGFWVTQANRHGDVAATGTTNAPPATSTLAAAPAITVLPGTTAFSLDTVEVGGKITTVAAEKTVELPMTAGQDLAMGGWAVDVRAAKAAAGVSATVDGTQSFAGAYGIARSDVGTVLKNPAFAPSGFTILIPAAALTPGKHRISLDILSANRSGYYRIPDKVDVTVK